VAEAAGAAIFQAFKEAVTKANKTCSDGGQNQDAHALEWIDLADSLPFSGFYPFYQESGVWNITELLQLKTCGIQNIEIEPASVCLVIGQTATLKVVGKDISGNSIALGDPPLPFREINKEDYVNPGVVSVSRPANDLIEVTGVNRGTAQIDVGVSLSGGTIAYRAMATITVKKTEVTVTPNQATIAVGGMKTLTATVIDGEGCTLEWRSSKDNVAEVNSAGLVTGIFPGETNITATCGDAFGVAVITVSAPGGYLLTWEATFTTTYYRYAIGSYYTSESTTTGTGNWSGSAFIGYDQAVQSVSTSGYNTSISITSTTYDCQGFQKLSIRTADILATIPPSGGEDLKPYLYIVEVVGPSGPYILEPFHHSGGSNNTHIKANYTSNYNFSDEGCPEGAGYSNTIENYEDFYFYFPNKLPNTNILPDDATRRSFSKEIVNAFSACYDGYLFTGTECISEDTVYRVRVLKLP
jgi:uncharacterized protein YjdB